MTSETVRPTAPVPRLVFQRSRTSARDQTAFLGKLVLVLVLGAAGAALVLTGDALMTTAGVVVLGGLYAHMVELQHQCLHHSAFLRTGPHRPVGVLLGLPMFVAHSHYRIRHLQHHRYLGTERDSEFFGFDTRQPLTPTALLAGLFDYRRFLTVAVDVQRSWRGKWRYEDGQISPRMSRACMAEYRLMTLTALGGTAACVAGWTEQVLLLWVLPVLLVSTPVHFLIELPEHIKCDDDTTDVLRNTRSISGSRFSRWFTNGNNLHVEHHAAMTVPINRLTERHAEVRQFARYVEHSYWTFYRRVIREATHAARRRPGPDSAE
ncbi:fatty acid desaturase family protein [Streptomyces odontomachi]|uniref:fatty acid desaturase family protein n=1 Tax=Streptomyces odontomachi TaxID=2944940 RepID=UPI00210EA4BD|nr:fatty acid desaturase [Streptomyces sp. ODS25]